jgi:hypothetical protein
MSIFVETLGTTFSVDSGRSFVAASVRIEDVELEWHGEYVACSLDVAASYSWSPGCPESWDTPADPPHAEVSGITVLGCSHDGINRRLREERVYRQELSRLADRLYAEDVAETIGETITSGNYWTPGAE